MIYLCAILFIIASVEGMFRVVYYLLNRPIGVNSRSFNYVPHLGFWRSEAKAGFAIDRFGFVVNDAAEASRDLTVKSPDEFRVIVFGGSTVEGFDASLPGHTIPGYLQTLLTRKFQDGKIDKKVTVINAGVSGYFSGQELAFLTYYAQAVQPDFAVFLDGTNDYIIWCGDGSGVTTLLGGNCNDYEAEFFDSYNRLFSFGGLALAAVKRLGENSATADVVFKLLARSDRLGAMVATRTDGQTGQNEAVAKYVPLHVRRYAANIRSAVGVARARALPVAYFFQPSILGPSDSLTATEKGFLGRNLGTWHNVPYFAAKPAYYDAVRNTLPGLAREFAADDGIVVADLSRIFDGKANTTEVYMDHVHYNDRGNELVAEGILGHAGAAMLAAARR